MKRPPRLLLSPSVLKSSSLKVLLAFTLVLVLLWCWSSTLSSNIPSLNKSRTELPSPRLLVTLISSLWVLSLSFVLLLSPILICKYADFMISSSSFAKPIVHYSVIKSRMQVSQQGDEKYNSILDGFKKIIATEGITGLYKGISSKIVQSVLSAAFLFLAKEVLFDWSVWVLVLLGARKAKIAAPKTA